MTTHATATAALDHADTRMLEATIEADAPAWPGPHDCHREAVEYATTPRRDGAFTVTTACGLCSRILGSVRDSVF